MRTIRIDGADPKPLGAPRDWDPDRHGHCGGLFIRREIMGGIHYMRSAWEFDQTEALLQLGGGKLVLGIAGHEHPVVHLQVEAPPEDAEPVYAARRTIDGTGRAAARVDAIYPHGGGRRCYCEVILNDDPFATGVSAAIDKCDELAVREGWLRDPERTT